MRVRLAIGGLGILVLFKEQKSWLEKLVIVALLYEISVFVVVIESQI
jgi:hypothetical protein